MLLPQYSMLISLLHVHPPLMFFCWSKAYVIKANIYQQILQ